MYVQTRDGLGQTPQPCSPPSVPSWLQSISEEARVRVAIQRGNRDLDKLTNLVFFARHPERGGRKLVKGEPCLRQLAQEWLQIRDQTVKSVLNSLASSTPVQASSPPFAVAKPSVAATAPRLIKIENTPRDYSLYVDISLGIGYAPNRQGKKFRVESMTGVFIPKGYRPRRDVDLILYLHGHKSRYPGDRASIDRYWDSGKFPFFALREGINDSGKNVILVAPTLGPRSQPGSLTQPGGMDVYLDQVMAALLGHGPYSKSAQVPTLRNIVLACHSGGGSPMLRIATVGGRYTANIQECWGFDCLYSGYENMQKTKKRFTQPLGWIRWAETHKSKKLFIYYQNSTELESQYLGHKANARRLGNVIVAKSNAKKHSGSDADPHFWVPITHWKDRIQNAPFLVDR